jgi:hypothetical protein
VRTLGVVVLASGLLAGCGGGSEPAAVEPTQTESAATTSATRTTGAAPTTTSQPEQLALRLYFLQDGKLAATSRSVASTRAVGRAALTALAAGPSAAERDLGFTTACPADQLETATLTITNGDAALVPRLEGACGDQAAWTLLQFPTVSSVNGAARADLEHRAPAILVDSPVPFEAVSSPLRVTGTANTFEATFEYDLLGAHGETLAHDFVTASSGNGTRGTFDFTIPFEVERPVDGRLVVYESSAEDGSRINIRRIPLRLQPS